MVFAISLQRWNAVVYLLLFRRRGVNRTLRTVNCWRYWYVLYVCLFKLRLAVAAGCACAVQVAAGTCQCAAADGWTLMDGR